MRFAVRSFVAFATTGTASAEAAIAAAAGTQAWSDRDRLDQDCYATMKVDYLNTGNVLLWALSVIFGCECGQRVIHSSV